MEADIDNGTIELAFEATHHFTTPRGDVVEGFLAAMLHDTLGPALIGTLEPDRFITTLDLQASFCRTSLSGPTRGTRPRRPLGRRHRVHGGPALRHPDDDLVAIGLATARIIEFDSPGP
jgi:acyl-coenzyme A thioesterase PaaI-like protein